MISSKFSLLIVFVVLLVIFDAGCSIGRKVTVLEPASIHAVSVRNPSDPSEPGIFWRKFEPDTNGRFNIKKILEYATWKQTSEPNCTISIEYSLPGEKYGTSLDKLSSWKFYATKYVYPQDGIIFSDLALINSSLVRVKVLLTFPQAPNLLKDLLDPYDKNVLILTRQ